MPLAGLARSKTTMNSQPCHSLCRRILWLACVLIALVMPAQRAVAQATPSISQQPQSQSVLVSSNVGFSVVASGQSPLVYQWHFNGVPLTNGGRFSGATNATLFNANVLAGDAGSYFVTVTNRHDMITSAVATLTVLFPPGISVPPASQSVALNSNALFTVTATGTPPLFYRWQRSGTNLSDSANVTGSATATLALGAIQPAAAADYRVVVSNAFGVVTSPVATLTVLMPPQIVTPPGDVAVLLGGNFALSVTATGDSPLAFRWQKDGANIAADARISGATTDALSVSGALTGDAGSYRVVVSNSIGVATSAVAVVTVNSPPAMDSQPSNASVVLGSNVTLSVTVTGDPPFQFQWQKNGTNLSDAGPVSGSTTAALTIQPVAAGDAGNYRVQVSNAFGAITSHAATLIVLLPPEITSQPTNTTKPLGANVSFTSLVAGTAPLSYSWRKDGLPLTDDARISGTTTGTLSITGIQTNDAGDYQLIVTNAYGSATGDVATLTVLLPPVFVLQPGSQLWVASLTASLTSLATATEPVSYRWHRNGAVLSNDARFSGTTNSTLSVSNVLTTDAGNYTVVAASAGGNATSQVAVVTVVVPPAIMTQPRGYSVPVGLPVTLSGAATGTAPLKYQWLLNSAPVANATNTPLVMSNLLVSQFGAYQLVATNLGGAVTSSVAQLTVGPVGAWGNIGTVANFPIWPAPGLTNVISVSAGSYYCAALRADGTVYVWGNSPSNPSLTNLPAGLANVVGIAAGSSHMLALISDGTVRAWGLGSSGQTNVPAGLSNVVAVSAGSAHSAALRADGTVVVWGFTPRENQTNIPPSLMNVAAIDAGGNHTLALRENGTVEGWGGFSAPAVPVGLVDVAGISSAPVNALNLALLSNGTVRAWGTLVSGAPTAALNVPAGLAGVLAVEGAGGTSAASGVALALRSNRTVVAWGSNVIVGLTNVPPGLSNVVLLAGGVSHVLALVNDGRPLLLRPPVGGNFHTGRQLSLKTKVTGDAPLAFQWFKDGNPIEDATNQNLVIPSSQFSDAGSYHLTASNALGFAQSLAVPVNIIEGAPVLMSQPAGRFAYYGSPWSVGATVVGSGPMALLWFKDGLPYASGTNELSFDRAIPQHGGAYQLIASNAFGSVTSSVAQVTFTRIAIWGSGPSLTNGPQDLNDMLDVTAAYTHLLAIKPDRTVAAWGTTLNNATNVPAGLSNVIAVTGGASFSVALRENGRAVAWGLNNFGQTNVPASATNLVAVSAGIEHVLALRSNGTVVVWGNGANDRTNIPPGLSGVVAVSAGQWHSVALKSDGTIVGWGFNWVQPVGLSNVVAIAAGFSHTVALRADRTIWTSGTGSQTPPAGLTGIAQIASGGTIPQNFGHSLALRADGTLVGWGNGASGQLNFPSELQSAVKLSCGGLFSVAMLGDRSPFFTLSPVDGSLNTGGTFQINTLSVGKPPMDYQWHLNSSPIPGATNPNFTLPSAHPSQSGDYQLVAMNEFGSATSAVATVTVSIPTPVLLLDGVDTNGFMFHFTSVAGVLYVVEHTAALSPASWIELERRFGIGGIETVIDPDVSSDERFYRVRALFAPSPGLKPPTWNGSALEFQFNTVPGARYVIEYKNTLDAANWMELSRHDATGSSLTVTDPGPHGESRFYRIKVE